jgi:hypothetical protein
LEGEEKREQLEIGKMISTFSGERSSDVILLIGDHEGFLNDEKTVDFILDKVMKPCGKLSLKSSTANNEISSKLVKHLGLSGFLKVKVSSDQLITAEKDKSEVGEVKPLSFAKTANTNGVKVDAWKISATDETEGDFIDEDALLDEEDWKKPDPASLKVCGTTGKRKACKDCSCGLAEELSGASIVSAPAQKSACGSCYLGDAFRCATCPYLGTKPFKPGEKVQMANDIDL